MHRKEEQIGNRVNEKIHRIPRCEEVELAKRNFGVGRLTS